MHSIALSNPAGYHITAGHPTPNTSKDLTVLIANVVLICFTYVLSFPLELFQRYRKDSRKSIGDSTFFEKVNLDTICWIDAPQTDFNILSVYMSTASDFNILVIGQSAPS